MSSFPPRHKWRYSHFSFSHNQHVCSLKGRTLSFKDEQIVSWAPELLKYPFYTMCKVFKEAAVNNTKWPSYQFNTIPFRTERHNRILRVRRKWKAGSVECIYCEHFTASSQLSYHLDCFRYCVTFVSLLLIAYYWL